MKEQIRKEYRLRFSSIEAYRNNVWRILTERFFNRYIPPDSTILELGCGWGEFVNNVRAKTKYAIDINPEGNERLGSSIRFINQDCSEKWPLSNSSLDIIFASNFLANLISKTHIEQTIIEVKRCLKPGGKFICLGPNIKFLHGYYWYFWDTHIGLSETSLSELLQLYNFKIETCLDKFLPFKMSKEKQPPLIYLKIYLAFPILWKLFGKQFLIIAQNIKTSEIPV